MKCYNIFFSFVILLWAGKLSAQYGLRVFYGSPTASELYTFLESENRLQPNANTVFNAGVTAQLDYWLRLPNHRVEFYPYIHYADFKAATTPELALDYSQIGAGVNVHLYPFDFYGDCDCPTFKKQNDFLRKGFFFLLGGGFLRSEMSAAADIRQADESFNQLAYRVGLGLDLGINSLLTLTPIFQYERLSSTGFNALGPVVNPRYLMIDDFYISTGTFTQWMAGLRLGIRLDHKNY